MTYGSRDDKGVAEHKQQHMRLPAAAAWGEEWIETEEEVGNFYEVGRASKQWRRKRKGDEERRWWVVAAE